MICGGSLEDFLDSLLFAGTLVTINVTRSLKQTCSLISFQIKTVFSPLFVLNVYATGVINDPVEFAIFAYVDTWAGLGGWGGDDDVSFTCTHVTCYASHGEGWVGGVGMMTFLSLAHM